MVGGSAPSPERARPAWGGAATPVKVAGGGGGGGGSSELPRAPSMQEVIDEQAADVERRKEQRALRMSTSPGLFGTSPGTSPLLGSSPSDSAPNRWYLPEANEMTSLRQIQNEELLTRAARASVDAASPSPPTTILGFAIAASPPAAAAAAPSPGPSPPAAAAPSPSSSSKACKYFARPGGCKNGDACRFAHVVGGGAPSPPEAALPAVPEGKRAEGKRTTPRKGRGGGRSVAAAPV